MSITDTLGRPLHDLRISVTDRCNFRCVYCMPKEVFGSAYRFMDRKELLSFEEIARVAATFVSLGVEKLRITGGEPLVRRDLERLIELLAPLGADLTLTTNGSLLPAKAEALAKAGLRRITVEPRLARRRDVPGAERRRLPGRPGARGHRRRRGRRTAGEGELCGQARRQRRRAAGARRRTSAAPATRSASSSTWTSATRTAGASTTSFRPPRSSVRSAPRSTSSRSAPAYPGEVARRYRYLDGSGEFGVISSVTQPFCGACTRARLSAEGKLYTCLFAIRGHDLRALIRGGASDDELAAAVQAVWGSRSDRYSELRSAATTDLPKVEMSYIGG